MVRRHRLIETWLVQHYGYGWDEVHDEAEVLEHAMSDRLLDAIDEQLGFPEHDPHGDPIPRADGSVVRPNAIRSLDATAPGHVVRISDRDPLLLRHLAAEGIGLGVLVHPPQPTAFGATVTVDGRAHELGTDALASIWVSAATP